MIDARKRLDREHAEMQDIQRRVRLSLRLRKLMKCPSITMAQFKLCCSKLMRHAGSLMIHTDGVSLRVSKANKVAEYGTVVDIAWDFEL